MSDSNSTLAAIRAKAVSEEMRITQHAQQEMTEEAILVDHVLYAFSNGQIIENYPDHRRGPCCLLHGVDQTGRDIHVVCTTSDPALIIITVYLPLPPRWISPIQRRQNP